MSKLSLEQIEQLDKNRLTETEIMFLKLRTTMTLQEIADTVGLTRQWVAKIVQGAMGKIKDEI